MRKLNLRAFCRKVGTTNALNRLLISIAQDENLDYFFPAIEKGLKPKDKVELLIDHIKNLAPEIRIELIERITTIYNVIDKESVAMAKGIIGQYTISNDNLGHVIASENDIDFMIQLSIASIELIYDLSLLSECFKKKNWKNYNVEKLDNKIILPNDYELPGLELQKALGETLNTDESQEEYIVNVLHNPYHDIPGKATEIVKIIALVNTTESKNNYYVAYIPEFNKVIISGKGDNEKLYTIAESAMRIIYGLDTSAEGDYIDLSPFKVKADDKHPLKSVAGIKNWKIKGIEIINEASLEILNIKLKPQIAKSGMTQMWEFFASFGNIRDINAYGVVKLTLIFETNNIGETKSFERVPVTLNRNNIDLNLLHYNHRNIWNMLRTSNIISDKQQ